MRTPAPKVPDLAPRAGKMLVVDAQGRATIEDAAAYFDIEVKRLRGFIFRNKHALGDPIGNVAENWVLPVTVERWLRYHRTD